jgi:hypothetical protein
LCQQLVDSASLLTCFRSGSLLKRRLKLPDENIFTLKVTLARLTSGVIYMDNLEVHARNTGVVDLFWNETGGDSEVMASFHSCNVMAVYNHSSPPRDFVQIFGSIDGLM